MQNPLNIFAHSKTPVSALASLVGLVAAVLLVSGCGVPERIRQYNTTPEKGDPFVVYMNDQVGHLSFDEALATWGHPKAVTNGDRIFLATWGPAEAQKSHGEFGNLFLTREVSPEANVNVVFDVETRELASWGFSKR